MKADSPLADGFLLTSRRSSPRQGKIKGLIVHPERDMPAENLALAVETGLPASAHYIIGNDGKIIQTVPEGDRAWSTGGPWGRQKTPPEWTGVRWDHWSVSIFAAGFRGRNGYRLTGPVLDRLVLLAADICRRNGIPRLLWENDPSLVGQWDRQNLALHGFFSDGTGCPGPWLAERMGVFAEKVSRLLENTG